MIKTKQKNGEKKKKQKERKEEKVGRDWFLLLLSLNNFSGDT